MKNLFVLFLLFSFTLFFSQKKYYILFNPNQDKIIYYKYNNKSLIDGIKIFFNEDKFTYFIPANKKSDFTSNKLPSLKTITRTELYKIVKSDNSNKKIIYIIIKKEKNIYKYYFMDHMFRTIVD